MSGGTRRAVLRLTAGAVTVASWLVIGLGLGNALSTPGRTDVDDTVDVLGLLAWFLVPGVLACLAGWRRDPVMALSIYLGGIVGAAVVAWVAGAPEVEPDADPAMRVVYEQMVIVIAAGTSAVLGFLGVVAGYSLGRVIGSRRSTAGAARTSP